MSSISGVGASTYIPVSRSKEEKRTKDFEQQLAERLADKVDISKAAGSQNLEAALRDPKTVDVDKLSQEEVLKECWNPTHQSQGGEELTEEQIQELSTKYDLENLSKDDMQRLLLELNNMDVISSADLRASLTKTAKKSEMNAITMTGSGQEGKETDWANHFFDLSLKELDEYLETVRKGQESNALKDLSDAHGRIGDVWKELGGKEKE